MTEAIIIGLGVLWFLYKLIATNETKYLLISLVLITLQLSRWPLFLNTNLAFGLIGIIGAVLMGVEYFIKKRITSVYLYILLFLGMGGVFLTQSFFTK